MATRKFYETHAYDKSYREWPEDYPDVLKPISWNYGAICGPYLAWHNRCGGTYKESMLFRKKNLCNIFVRLDIQASQAVELINFICNAFTLYFVTGEGFKICLKRKEIDGKKVPLFSKEDIKKFFESIGLTTRKGTELLKRVIKLETDSYNDLARKTI